MEFILIHRMLGPVPPEIMKKALELAKAAILETEKVVPGGKVCAAYAAFGRTIAVCIWEVPSVDALIPFIEQLNFLGWETEVIPAEKMEAAIPRLEKILAQQTGS